MAHDMPRTTSRESPDSRDRDERAPARQPMLGKQAGHQAAGRLTAAGAAFVELERTRRDIDAEGILLLTRRRPLAG
jgi:hypothetical protein